MKTYYEILPLLVVLFIQIRGASPESEHEREFGENSKEDRYRDMQVFDCRFWRGPKQEIARSIMNNKIDKQGSVFYFWSSASQECQPCRVCNEQILSECTYIKDTVCISQREWVQMGNKQDRQGEERGEDEGVIVYKAATPTPKQIDVFGKLVYTDATQLYMTSS